MHLCDLFMNDVDVVIPWLTNTLQMRNEKQVLSNLMQLLYILFMLI